MVHSRRIARVSISRKNQAWLQRFMTLVLLAFLMPLPVVPATAQEDATLQAAASVDETPVAPVDEAIASEDQPTIAPAEAPSTISEAAAPPTPPFARAPAPALARPGPGNQVVPLFRKPFAAEWPMGNPFDHDLPFEYPLPDGRPKDNNGYLLTWWGEATSGNDGHYGIDWTMPAGTPLLAMADGTVAYAREHSSVFGCPPSSIHDPARTVQIRHTAPGGSTYLTEYDHLGRIDVKEGQAVRAGTQIGLSDNSGCSAVGDHLHFTTYRVMGQKLIRIDPYGWDGPAPDPWAKHPEGTASQWLWLDGQAPLIFREVRSGPNPGPSQNPVAITALRWMGWRDTQNPNNEFVELMLDERFAPEPTFDLSGFTLKNNAGDAFHFPDGFHISQGHPIRVYAGPGEDIATELYWGLSGRAWDAMGDCAHLVRPNGNLMYRLRSSAACT